MRKPGTGLHVSDFQSIAQGGRWLLITGNGHDCIINCNGLGEFENRVLNPINLSAALGAQFGISYNFSSLAKLFSSSNQ